MRIASWNVNGLRAAEKKGFLDWLEESGADIVGVQEVRAREEQLSCALLSPPGWHAVFVAAERKGYSGVGIYSRRPPDEVETNLGDPALDREGRALIARYDDLTVVSAYFPNGNGKNRDNSRVRYKLRFYRTLFRHLEPEVRAGGKVVVMGDFNTSPYPIDLARPKQNKRTSGFLESERRELTRWLRSGYHDSFRMFEPGGGHYTWWSQRQGVRERNVGWRLDLALVSEGLAPHVQAARIHPEVHGSDHCPISLDMRLHLDA